MRAPGCAPFEIVRRDQDRRAWAIGQAVDHVLRVARTLRMVIDREAKCRRAT